MVKMEKKMDEKMKKRIKEIFKRKKIKKISK
jgi:hypothetical protein